MDPFNPDEDFSDLKVSKDAVIETVAESILNSRRPVTVVDDSGEAVGSLHASKVVSILFGSHADLWAEQAP